MWIGVAKIYLDFFNNEKSQEKHRLLKELCDQLRKTYNISALEIDSFDDPEKGVIGFSVVIPRTQNEKSAKELVQKICTQIDQIAPARVVAEDWDLLSH